MPHPDQPLTEDEEDLLHWATIAVVYAGGYTRILADAIERGDADLQVPPSAWENTMTAIEGVMLEEIRGRLHGPTSVTAEDVERMRRLRELGSAALLGGDRAPELYPLALRCMESLFGPDWKRSAREAASYARDLIQVDHPRNGT